MNRFLVLCNVALLLMVGHAYAQTLSQVIVVNANFTCGPSTQFVLVDASATNVTITLTPATVLGQIVTIVVKDGTNNITVVKGAGDVTIVDPAGDTYMGGANGGTLCASGEAVALESDGLGKWYVIYARNGSCGNWVGTSSNTTAQSSLPKANAGGQMTYWDNVHHVWVLTSGYSWPATITTTNSVGMKIQSTNDTALSVVTSGATGVSVSTSNAPGVKISSGGKGMEIQCYNEVGGTNLSTTTHFMDFVDGASVVRGCITGQNSGDLSNDPDYQANINNLNDLRIIADFNAAIAVASDITGVINIGLAIGPGACAGACVGACGGVVAIDAGQILVNAADAVLALANYFVQAAADDAAHDAKNVFVNAVQNNLGVSYSSSAGDYAEWLPKLSASEKYSPGQIISVQDGKITRNTDNPSQLLVISQQPIVLGNVPTAGKESEFEKVAFLGQVPVRVLGPVNTGDYILPAGLGTGDGIAVAPAKMRTGDYKKIVGIAWSSSSDPGLKFVNVSVGLNGQAASSEVENQGKAIQAQELELRDLNSNFSESNAMFTKMIPGFSDAIAASQQMNTASLSAPKDNRMPVLSTPGEKVAPAPMEMEMNIKSPENASFVDSLKQARITEALQSPYRMTHSDALRGFALACKLLQQRGVDINRNVYVKRFVSDPAFKESEISKIQERTTASMEHYQNLLMRRGPDSSAK